MTVTDVDTTTKNSSPDAINTTPHAPNAVIAPYYITTTTENKTSMRKLLYGQEYPIPKGDIIKKVFDIKASVERCVAYIHVLYQLLVCPRYNGAITCTN